MTRRTAVKAKPRQFIEWWFRPLYAEHDGLPAVVEASNLDRAFGQARMRWPMADGWRCCGRVNPRFPDNVMRRDSGWVERVVRVHDGKK